MILAGITSGALGDVLGCRRVFLAGLVLFVVSCALIALSRSGGGVIAGRMIQGTAAATILAQVLLDLVTLSGGGESAAKVEQELLKLARSCLPLAPASGPLGGVVSAISSVRTRCGVSALAVLVEWTARGQQIRTPRPRS